jgi:hypothetical protein
MVLQGRLWYRAALGVGRRSGRGWLQLCLIPVQLHEPGLDLGSLCETGFGLGASSQQCTASGACACLPASPA